MIGRGLQCHRLIQFNGIQFSCPIGEDGKANAASIAQFSEKDAMAFEKYEEFQKKGNRRIVD